MTIQNTDLDILQTAVDWLEQNHNVALVTVVNTWGSSPRPRGSMLVMREDGIHAGSVSGGCVEDDLLQRYKNGQLAQSNPNRINYGVDRQDALRHGLPCGGRLELVIEQLESATPLKAIIGKIQQGQLIRRRLCMNTGEASLHQLKPTDEVYDFFYSDDEMVKVYGAAWHMLLIGAGHLSRYVANIANMLDYRVSVCDPREQYQPGWDITGLQFSRQMPDDIVKSLTNPGRCLVIALSHDPKLDDMALMQALVEDFFYVGALGSRRSSEQRKARLLQLGITQNQLSKLHAPVGLAIGSHTPAEIAVAIMAQITALRNKIHYK